MLDVWEGEPAVPRPLLAASRFGTAHIAGYSHDGKLRATDMLFSAVCRELGRDPGELRPAAEPISLDAPSLAPPELACWLVQQVYDIREDDRLLRAAPDNFDALRKSYRRRRELSFLSISNGGWLDEEARALCVALGCEVKTC